MADFTIREGRRFGFDCTVDGQLVVGMDFRPGLPIRLTPRQQAQRSYSHRDGVTRETAFEHTLDGVRTPIRGRPRQAGRASLCERVGVAGPSEARDAVQFC